jgi:hypothetical protein
MLQLSFNEIAEMSSLGYHSSVFASLWLSVPVACDGHITGIAEPEDKLREAIRILAGAFDDSSLRRQEIGCMLNGNG